MTARTPLPPAFRTSLAEQLGREEAARLCDALDGEPPVSIRRNAAKGYESGGVPVPWCTGGRYLPERPQFTLDPLLHAGSYYVQEAASMFVEQAYRALPAEPARVLDLCAAPGGKSTLWRSLLPDGAVLVCNEPVHLRANILAENMAKWGQPDVIITEGSGADFAALTGYFDLIATDVPCSGEGMFRKDDGARREWTPDSPARCAALQRDIVRSVWPALRTGGHLVYSTCTFNRAEDEDNVAWICRELGATPVTVVTKEQRAAWGIGGDTTGRELAVYHFYPRPRGSHLPDGEGFFLALLRKDAPTPPPARPARQPGGERPLSKRDTAALEAWLQQGEAFQLQTTPSGNAVFAFRRTLKDDLRRISGAVKVRSAGIPLATAKGGKWMPRHELALSTQLAPEAFPRVELSLEDARNYLRRAAICVEAPRGYVVVTHKGRALGFVNNLGSRANNLYPQEWRIRQL